MDVIDNEVVVIDGEVSLRNVIDNSEVELKNVIDNGDGIYPVLRVGGGSSDYERLTNHPRIEDVEVIGNKTFEDYGLSEFTGEELIEILN